MPSDSDLMSLLVPPSVVGYSTTPFLPGHPEPAESL
ncbi:hypothetical protein NOCARDAX2BIS_210095 [Nocardioides sp. AX2bis]|nr:hypothetical protein NOCARDAX2BIS_210095 [Nocardioides sp. AX2bis]